jgi:hypothetical protein
MLQNISVVLFTGEWRPDSRMVLPPFSFFGTENSKGAPTSFGVQTLKRKPLKVNLKCYKIFQ